MALAPLRELLQQANNNNRLLWPALISILIITLSTLAFALFRFARERRKRYQIFKLGNVPQASERLQLFGGNLFDLISLGDNTQKLHELHLRLGKTFGVFYGPDPWAMTVDLNLLQKVFVDEGSVHVNVTDLRLPFVTEINESLAQLKGDKWRQVRRVMGPSFTTRHMKSDNVFSDITKVSDMFMDFIAGHRAEDPSRDGSIRVIVDMHYAFKRFSLEVIFRVAFGQEHYKKFEPNEKDKLIDWLNDGSHMLHGPFVHIGIVFEWAQSLIGLCAPFTPLGAVIRYVHSIIDDSLSKRRAILKEALDSRKSSQSGGLPPIERKTIDSLIERFDLGKMSDETLKANLFFVLLAGYETSANTLTLMFYFLASNQEAQEKLRGSIVSHGGERTEYLDWVIQETLRLFPAVPVAIGRVLEHDVEHEGMRLIKGTTLVADIWSIHRWPDYWLESESATGIVNNDDLNNFRPERFGEPPPKGVSHARYFAFGIGPRYCIGQNLALNEIKMITKRILSKYRVSLCESSPRKIDAKSPNLIHFIISHKIDLEFTEISHL